MKKIEHILKSKCIRFLNRNRNSVSNRFLNSETDRYAIGLETEFPFQITSRKFLFFLFNILFPALKHII